MPRSLSLWSTLALLLFASHAVAGQERLEVVQWYYGDEERDVREVTKYDTHGRPLSTVATLDGRVTTGTFYFYSEGAQTAYDYDGNLAWTSEHAPGRTETIYYDDGEPSLLTTEVERENGIVRHVTYTLPDRTVLDAYERETLPDGTEQITRLDPATMNPLRVEIREPETHHYTYERERDAEGRVVQERAFLDGRLVYEKTLHYR